MRKFFLAWKLFALHLECTLIKENTSQTFILDTGLSNAKTAQVHLPLGLKLIN